MTEKEVYMTKQADDIRLLPNDLQSLQFTLPFRTDEGAKQDFGRAVIVGGSASFVGAPCFAAESAAEVLALAGEAAMRSGAGTTVLALPDILLPALYPHLRYSAAFALPSEGGNIVFDEAAAKKLFKGATSVAMGMGMADGDAYSYARMLLDETDATLVLDADGLKCARGIGDFGGRAVLTPHIGEAARLTGLTTEEISARPAEICRQTARELSAVVILKGHESYISDGESVYVNRTGNGKLSKGGSGDVLSGIIGGLLAWKVQPLHAARVGAYALGRAAEFSKMNAVSHLPDDIMYCLPLVFDELQGVMRLGGEGEDSPGIPD